MTASWDDEYLTVNEIAEHLKLNPQTLRNWIDHGQLPAVRIGRRVRVRRADLDRILAHGTTAVARAQATPIAPLEVRDQLALALERAQRLLGRLSVARRGELAEGLQQLTEAVAGALEMLPDESVSPTNDTTARSRGSRVKKPAQ